MAEENKGEPAAKPDQLTPTDEGTKRKTYVDDQTEDELYEIRHPIRRRFHRFHLKAVGEDAANWDYVAARPPGSRITEVESIVLMMKAVLGIGVYDIHKSYESCGLYAAMLLSFLLAYIMIIWNYVIVQSVQIAYGRTRVPAMSYSDLAEATFDIGPFPRLRKCSTNFRYLVDAMQIFFQCRSCWYYHRFGAIYVIELFEGELNPTQKQLRPYIGGLTIPIIALCMYTELRQIVPYALISNLFTVLTSVGTIVFGLRENKKSLKDFPLYKSLGGIISFVGPCCYALTNVITTLPIENCMYKPENIFQTAHKAMLIICAVTMSNGFFGYYGFGENSLQPITFNFPETDTTLNLKLASVFIMCVNYVIHFYVAFQCMWFYLKDSHDPEKHWYIERVYRGVVVAIISILVFVFPATPICDVMAIYISPLICLIFPSLIQLLLIWDEPGLGKYNWRFWRFLAFTSIAGGILFASAKDM